MATKHIVGGHSQRRMPAFQYTVLKLMYIIVNFSLSAHVIFFPAFILSSHSVLFSSSRCLGTVSVAFGGRPGAIRSISSEWGVNPTGTREVYLGSVLTTKRSEDSPSLLNLSVENNAKREQLSGPANPQEKFLIQGLLFPHKFCRLHHTQSYILNDPSRR